MMYFRPLVIRSESDNFTKVNFPIGQQKTGCVRVSQLREFLGEFIIKLILEGNKAIFKNWGKCESKRKSTSFNYLNQLKIEPL